MKICEYCGSFESKEKKIEHCLIVFDGEAFNELCKSCIDVLVEKIMERIK